MSNFSFTQFEGFFNEFHTVSKRILKKDLSVNPVKLAQYEKDITRTFNDITAYAKVYFAFLEPDDQIKVRSRLLKSREILSRCYGNLKSKCELSDDILEKVIESKGKIETGDTAKATDVEKSGTSESSEKNLEEDKSDQSEPEFKDATEYLDSGEKEKKLDKTEIVVDNPDNSIIERVNPVNNRRVMAEDTPQNFLRLCAQNIPRSFSGDPLGLTSFVNSIKLLQTMAGNTHGELLKQFVMTRLEGKPLEVVPDNPETVDKIIEALIKSIKPENSKIIAGRMTALRNDRIGMQDFSKKAEELAEALQRSLVVEGISQEKSKQLAIEKTIEMCRASAKSDLVKSVLAASTFEDPKEVVAKFVIENATETKEKQVLSFSSNRGRVNQRGRGRNFRAGYNNNFNRNFRPGNNNNPRRNFRNSQFMNNRGHRGNRNNNNANIRYAENAEAPAEERRGPPNTTQENQVRVMYSA